VAKINFVSKAVLCPNSWKFPSDAETAWRKPSLFMLRIHPFSGKFFVEVPSGASSYFRPAIAESVFKLANSAGTVASR
jgi:hypothetical protein